MKKQKIKIGIAWYIEEQWRLLKSVAADTEGLDDTYNNWRKNIKKLIEKIKKRGNDPEKVDIDVEKLIKWCAENKKPINRESRSEYVTVLLQQKYG